MPLSMMMGASLEPDTEAALSASVLLLDTLPCSLLRYVLASDSGQGGASSSPAVGAQRPSSSHSSAVQLGFTSCKVSAILLQELRSTADALLSLKHLGEHTAMLGLEAV